MPGRAPVVVTPTVKNVNVDNALMNGSDYILQNVGSSVVEYVNYPTDPTGVDVAWHVLASGSFISYTADAGNPLWVRVSYGASRLAVSDA